MKAKILSMLLALSLAASLAVPAFAAESNEIYDTSESGQSEIRLRVVESGATCEHENAVYVDNKNGTHDFICDCGEVLVRGEQHVDIDADDVCDCCGASLTTDCQHENTHYWDNKDGTHDEVCECGQVVASNLAHEDTNADSTCDFCGADMDAPEPILIATVPLQLPVVADTSGNITVSENAEIVNHQDAGIVVRQVSVTPLSGWSRESISENFAVKSDNEKVFGLSFRGDENALTDGNWNIAGNDSLKLNMAMNLPKQSEAMSSTAIARVSFVLALSDDADIQTSSDMTGFGDQARINKTNKDLSSQYANRMLIFNDFARFAQSDNDYYTFGKPAVGVIEDMMVYYGLDYKVTSGTSSERQRNLNVLKEYIQNQASKADLQVMIDVTNGGAIPRSR